jgi:hypothetical protein
MNQYYVVGIIKNEEPEKGSTSIGVIYANSPDEAAKKYVLRGKNYASTKYLTENNRAIITVHKKSYTYDSDQSRKVYLFDVDYVDKELHLVHQYYPE